MHMKKTIITIVILFSLLTFVGSECTVKETVFGGINPLEVERDNITQIVTRFAGILAGAAATVALIFIIVGGIQYISSGGNQEQAGKAKSTLTWAIIGFILIMASYSIIYFFTDLVTKK